MLTIGSSGFDCSQMFSNPETKIWPPRWKIINITWCIIPLQHGLEYGQKIQQKNLAASKQNCLTNEITEIHTRKCHKTKWPICNGIFSRVYMLFAKQQHLVYWHICSSKYMISLIKIVPGSDFLTFQISSNPLQYPPLRVCITSSNRQQYTSDKNTHTYN